MAFTYTLIFQNKFLSHMEEGEIFLVEVETVLFTTLSKMGLKSPDKSLPGSYPVGTMVLSQAVKYGA